MRHRDNDRPQYEVVAVGGGRLAGPFAVIDTAVHAGVKWARKSREAAERAAAAFGTHYRRVCLNAHVRQLPTEPGEAPRVRAFVDDGRLVWARDCGACQGKGTWVEANPWVLPPGVTVTCLACDGGGVERAE